ncbi:MAG: winged helix-turn-helix transcriptional regulator [Paracoccaceae bacterium]
MSVVQKIRKLRSNCPLNCAVEFFGDKWSLLIVREIFFKGRRTFGQLLGMDEGISTGTLTDRITMLQKKGIISRKSRKDDRRSVDYNLTLKGKDLEPVLVEMVLWVASHEMTDIPEDLVKNLRPRHIFDQSCKRR